MPTVSTSTPAALAAAAASWGLVPVLLEPSVRSTIRAGTLAAVVPEPPAQAEQEEGGREVAPEPGPAPGDRGQQREVGEAKRVGAPPPLEQQVDQRQAGHQHQGR